MIENDFTTMLVEGMMRAAMTPSTIFVGTDSQGQPLWQKHDAPLQPVARAVAEYLSKSPEAQQAFTDAALARMDEIVPIALEMLAKEIVRIETRSWTNGRSVTIEPWAKPAIEAALAQALESRVVAHVEATMPDLPLSNYDVTINVTLTPKGT